MSETAAVQNAVMEKLLLDCLEKKKAFEAAKEKLEAEMAKRQLSSYKAANGARAQKVDKTVYAFDVELLRPILDKGELRRLCPPSPDTKALRELMQSDPKQFKRLAPACKITEQSYISIFANGN